MTFVSEGSEAVDAVRASGEALHRIQEAAYAFGTVIGVVWTKQRDMWHWTKVDGSAGTELVGYIVDDVPKPLLQVPARTDFNQVPSTMRGSPSVVNTWSSVFLSPWYPIVSDHSLQSKVSTSLSLCSSTCVSDGFSRVVGEFCFVFTS